MQMEPMTDLSHSSRATLLRLDQVKNRTCLSRSTIYAYMSEGRFPQAVSISERCVAWLEAEVDDWIAERIAARKCR
jgi:prophage regulatory protein